MSNSRGTNAGWEGPLWVVGFAGVCWILFGLLASFHLHGWKGFDVALVLTVLLFALGRLAVRKIVAATERERRDPRAGRGGNRAERRQRARRKSIGR